MYDSVFELLPFIQKFGLTLIATYSNIFNWLSTEYTLPLINTPLSVFEMLFGGGVTLVLGYSLTKWIVGIIP